MLTLKNYVKIKMDDHEASGSCLLAGSWWIGSSSLGRRTTVKLAGPASWWAVGESGVHSSHLHCYHLLNPSSGTTLGAGGDGVLVDKPRTIRSLSHKFYQAADPVVHLRTLLPPRLTPSVYKGAIIGCGVSHSRERASLDCIQS